MRIEDLDTPFLMVDLDALEENLDRYQQYFDRHSIGFRPHIKTHKTVAIAHMQMARGAIGLTCQKLGEADVMVGGGLNTDTLVPYNILGRQKLDLLVALAKRTRMTVSSDSDIIVRGISGAADAAGVSVGVLVEMELGLNRTGVTSSRQAVELARLIHDLPGLELRGIMGFPTTLAVRPLFQETLDLFDKDGLPHPVVSGGSTPDAMDAHRFPEVTEHRAGEYAMGGAWHLAARRHTVAQCSLRVVTTVVSRPTEGRAVLDAGTKTLSASVMKTDDGDRMGYVVEYPEAQIPAASEEHGHVDVSACDRKPEIGEGVQVLPVHPCPCVNEHDELVGARNGHVEAIWPIGARGKIR